MLTALILVCSLAITPELRNCDRNNALHVLQVPEQFGNPVMCMMRGQAYLAGTSIGQEMKETAGESALHPQRQPPRQGRLTLCSGGSVC